MYGHDLFVRVRAVQASIFMLTNRLQEFDEAAALMHKYNSKFSPFEAYLFTFYRAFTMARENSLPMH